jgi:hypothetical protein
MAVIGKEINSKAFTYAKEQDSFVAEASDFGPCDDTTVPAPFDRLYDDACDCGFVMVSERTGKKVVFALDETARDDEGEIKGWRFKPVTRGIKSTVVIFND